MIPPSHLRTAVAGLGEALIDLSRRWDEHNMRQVAAWSYRCSAISQVELGHPWDYGFSQLVVLMNDYIQAGKRGYP